MVFKSEHTSELSTGLLRAQSACYSTSVLLFCILVWKTSESVLLPTSQMVVSAWAHRTSICLYPGQRPLQGSSARVTEAEALSKGERPQEGWTASPCEIFLFSCFLTQYNTVPHSHMPCPEIAGLGQGKEMKCWLRGQREEKGEWRKVPDTQGIQDGREVAM